jgi:uncharacterized protein YjbI with pentapeptide repeats
METLTAFVRERACWKEPDAIGSETMARFFEDKGSPSTQSDYGPVTDIAAVLSVIVRRDSRNIKREKTERWRFNLRGTDLRKASLGQAHLEGADLSDAHLEGAFLYQAHLERTHLSEAHLEGASLSRAHLEGADLSVAHLEGANLRQAHLEGANLSEAHGNADTSLPQGVTRPVDWQPAQSG